MFTEARSPANSVGIGQVLLYIASIEILHCTIYVQAVEVSEGCRCVTLGADGSTIVASRGQHLVTFDLPDLNELDEKCMQSPSSGTLLCLTKDDIGPDFYVAGTAV